MAGSGLTSSAAPGSRASHGSDPDPDGSSPTGSSSTVPPSPRSSSGRGSPSGVVTGGRVVVVDVVEVVDVVAGVGACSPAPHRARRRRTAGRTRAAGRRHRQRVPSPQRPPVPPPRRTRGDAAGTCGGLPRAGARPSGSCGGWWCGALIAVQQPPQRTVALSCRVCVSGRHFRHSGSGRHPANSWRNLRPDSAATGSHQRVVDRLGRAA